MTIQNPNSEITIEDICSEKTSTDLVVAIKEGLLSTPKQLPSLLLWDTSGHQFFQKITESPSYYGTRADREIMVSNMSRLCDMLGNDGILLELGSGSIPNTHFILEEAARRNMKLAYLAHDICKNQLTKSLRGLSAHLTATVPGSNIKLGGIAGTYDDLFSWLPSQKTFQGRSIVAIWLGNSLSSYTDPQFSTLVQDLGQAFVKTKARSSRLILAIDGCRDETTIRNGYDAPDKTSSDFISSALQHANRLLRTEVFDATQWLPSCSFDDLHRTITWGYRSAGQKVLNIGDLNISCMAGEVIEIIQSRKRNSENVDLCIASTSLDIAETWQQQSVSWSWYVLEPAGKRVVNRE